MTFQLSTYKLNQTHTHTHTHKHKHIHREERVKYISPEKFDLSKVLYTTEGNGKELKTIDNHSDRH